MDAGAWACATRGPPSVAGDGGSTVPQRRYRCACITAPRVCGSVLCAPWRSNTWHGSTCFENCKAWRGDPHGGTTPHCRRAEPVARGPSKQQHTRAHSTPQHWLLCHLGLHKSEFEFDHTGPEYPEIGETSAALQGPERREWQCRNFRYLASNEHGGALRGTPGSACPQPGPNATELPSCAPISASR